MQKIDWEKTRAAVVAKVDEVSTAGLALDPRNPAAVATASPNCRALLVEIHLVSLFVAGECELDPAQYASLYSNLVVQLVEAALIQVRADMQHGMLHAIIDTATERLHRIILDGDPPVVGGYVDIPYRDVGDA